MNIHSTAIVSPDAELGEDVIVHPFATIAGGVQVGDGCEIGSHAVIHSRTRMGSGNFVAAGATLGGDPQDRKYKGEESYLQIGNDNEIREYVTLHRATGEGKATVIGDDNMFMAYSHVGHNCNIGSYVMIANASHCGGHVVVDDYVVIGGLCGIHQYARIGTMAMVGATSAVRRDVPPYMLAFGARARPRSINVVGLRRHGVNKETIRKLRKAYKILYRSELNMSDAIERIRREMDMFAELEHLIEFLEKIPEGRSGRQLNQ